MFGSTPKKITIDTLRDMCNITGVVTGPIKEEVQEKPTIGVESTILLEPEIMIEKVENVENNIPIIESAEVVKKQKINPDSILWL